MTASPPERSRPLSAVSVIIGLNVLVFVMWQGAASSPLLRAIMASSFVVSTAHLQAGFVWTLIGSEFSHIELWHIAINMFVLWSFGRLLERLWGTRVFVGFYLVAAVVASLSHCAVSTFLLGNSMQGAVGASGAVSGLLVAYAFAFPKHRIYLFGLLPVPALAGALGFIVLDFWGLVAQTQGGGLSIGHGAHLGGALAGALMHWFYLRRQFATRIELLQNGGFTRAEVEQLGRLRQKVEQHGVESLDPGEREFVQRLRQRSTGPR